MLDRPTVKVGQAGQEEAGGFVFLFFFAHFFCSRILEYLALVFSKQ